MYSNTIMVFDFETGSLDINKCEVIQVAAMAINRKTLEPIKDGIFETLIKPRDFNNLQDEALAINKKTREELKLAPSIDAVWKKLSDFISMFNNGKGNISAPIPAGKNIRHFDMPIFQRVCSELGYVDKNGNQNLLNRRNMYDLDEIMMLWFDNTTVVPNYKMDTLRDFFGLSKANAHDALTDVIQTSDIILHFLKLHRSIFPKIKFKDAFRK